MAAAVRAAFGLPDAGGYPGKKQKLFDEPAGPPANTWVFDTGPAVFGRASRHRARGPPVPPAGDPPCPPPSRSSPQRGGPHDAGPQAPADPRPRSPSGPRARRPLRPPPPPVPRAHRRPRTLPSPEPAPRPPPQARAPPAVPPVPYPTALELAEAASRDRKVVFGALRFVGQVRSTFFVCEGSDGLYLLDQHAAAERVTFHRLKRGYDAREVPSQKLLFPAIVAGLALGGRARRGAAGGDRAARGSRRAPPGRPPSPYTASRCSW